MQLESHLPMVATAILALPLVGFLWLGVVTFVHRAPSEQTISRLTAAVFVLALAGAGAVLASVFFGPRDQVTVHLGRWFSLPGYEFELTLLVDRLSASLMVLTTGICGLIGRFSVTYLHRERGFVRFFVLLHLFAAGMLLLVMAGSVDLLFAGWELVGITSVLLIAFFDERNGPVQNGLRTFITYRVCDVGLLMGAVLVHHYTHSAQLDTALGAGHWPLGTTHLSQGPATLIAILLAVGAIGKSAQLPVSSWLPRAMEGPTPSSALFYGALSVHAGVYLLLRTAPVFEAAPLARAFLIAVGALTAVHATLAGRAQTDAKNALAYATITQVGLMFVEIGLGLYVLAMVHLIGHACVRGYQLLKSPSALHEAHLLHAAAGGTHFHTGARVEGLLPRGAQRWLYGLALERFHLDALLDRLAHGVLALARRLDALDRYWLALQSGATGQADPANLTDDKTAVPRRPPHFADSARTADVARSSRS